MIAYCRVNRGCDPMEEYSANSFFELEGIDLPEPGSICTWRSILPESATNIRTRYRLRHLVSGRCMGLVVSPNGAHRLELLGNPKGSSSQDNERWRDQTSFVLINTKISDDPQIRTHQVVKILHPK